MKNKKTYVLLLILLFLLSSCASEPLVTEKNGVVTIQQSVDSPIQSVESETEFDFKQIPENITINMNSADNQNVLEIDADILVPEDTIYFGTLKPKFFDQVVIRNSFFEGKEIDQLVDSSNTVYFDKNNNNEKEQIYKNRTLSVNELRIIPRYHYDNPEFNKYNSIDANYAKFEDLNEENKQMVTDLTDSAEKLVTDLATDYVIDQTDISYTQTGIFLNIKVVNQIMGLKCCHADRNNPVSADGWIIQSSEGINSFNINAGFEIVSSETAQMQSWDKIIESAQQLVDNGTIMRPENSNPISHIELRYLIKNLDNKIEFCPVWCFFSVDPANTLLAELPLLNIFCINAQNGQLEYFNGF